jgi:hypothetical protein
VVSPQAAGQRRSLPGVHKKRRAVQPASAGGQHLLLATRKVTLLHPAREIPVRTSSQLAAGAGGGFNLTMRLRYDGRAPIRRAARFSTTERQQGRDAADTSPGSAVCVGLMVDWIGKPLRTPPHAARILVVEGYAPFSWITSGGRFNDEQSSRSSSGGWIEGPSARPKKSSRIDFCSISTCPAAWI